MNFICEFIFVCVMVIVEPARGRRARLSQCLHISPAGGSER